MWIMRLFSWNPIIKSGGKSFWENKKSFNILSFRYLCCDLGLQFVKVSGFDNQNGIINGFSTDFPQKSLGYLLDNRVEIKYNLNHLG